MDTVVVKAESENAKLCAILSIQGTQVYCFCVMHFLLVIVFLFKEAFLSSSSLWKVIEKFMREGFLKLIEYNSSRLCEVKLQFLRVWFGCFMVVIVLLFSRMTHACGSAKSIFTPSIDNDNVLNIAGILTHPVFSFAARIKFINCSHYKVWYFIFNSSVQCMILREMWNLLAIFRL